MKRLMVLISMITLMCCDLCSAGVSVVKNGSFEYDGYIDVTLSSIPEYWCNVSYDLSKFDCFIDNSWATNDSNSLTMNAYLYTSFSQDDSATITQSLYLNNAEQIVFDVYLYTTSGGWDTSAFTAGVLIDNTEIWNSDGLTYTDGVFMGHIAVDVNETFKDSEPHLLTLCLKADVGGLSLTSYYAQWDAVGIITPCGAVGYLPADFTHDCIVDINDLAVLAEGWLDPNGPDLTDDNDVNFADFAVFADSWMAVNSGGPFIPEPNFVFLNGDLNDDGIVDYSDVLVLCSNWLRSGGSCVREDLDEDGLIDFKDFGMLAGQWQEIGDLYGL